MQYLIRTKYSFQNFVRCIFGGFTLALKWGVCWAPKWKNQNEIVDERPNKVVVFLKQQLHPKISI